MRAWLPLCLFFLAGCDLESTPAPWTGPKRVTLVTPAIATPSDGVQLEDGTIVADEGDLSLYQAQTLSLSSPTPASLCAKGTFDALGDIPTEIDTCPAGLSGTWEDRAYLGGATLHTIEESYVAGLGLLVWNEEHTALYRLRVVGDSYDEQGVSKATFDYEPVP
jgi:hypothetical protein